MKRIIIADDHPVVRLGIECMLEGNRLLSIDYECSSGEELLYALERNGYDMLLLDLHMPGKDSLEILKTCKILYPDMPVVVFSADNDDNVMINILRAGASAFVSKDDPPGFVIKTLEETAQKGRYLSDEQQRKLSSMAINPGRTEELKIFLTLREQQILTKIAMGLPYDDIARELGLSKNTIANHRKNILKKLKLRNNSELTRFAIKQGMIF
jgi:DNA-binding NarL/FixJ family response regulator